MKGSAQDGTGRFSTHPRHPVSSDFYRISRDLSVALDTMEHGYLDCNTAAALYSSTCFDIMALDP
jgi:hypothetical protein